MEVRSLGIGDEEVGGEVVGNFLPRRIRQMTPAWPSCTMSPRRPGCLQWRVIFDFRNKLVFMLQIAWLITKLSTLKLKNYK